MRRKNERSSPKQKEGPSLERPESDELVKDRNRRKRPKVDASIFDSALSHTRRSDASEKTEENSVSTFGRFRLWTSFESPPVSVNT